MDTKVKYSFRALGRPDIITIAASVDLVQETGLEKGTKSTVAAIDISILKVTACLCEGSTRQARTSNGHSNSHTIRK